MTLKIGDNTIERDEEGYLLNPDDWSDAVTVQIALEEELQLNDEHWSIVHFMRAFYDEKKIAADVRYVVQHIVKELDYDKKQARNRIFQLFPYGYVKQACKIAGMKRPRNWSTG